jgi:hypothetical protein
MHGNAKEILDDFFIIQGVPIFVKKFGPSGVFFTDRHLLVLDGHCNHVTLKTIE